MHFAHPLRIMLLFTWRFTLTWSVLCTPDDMNTVKINNKIVFVHKARDVASDVLRCCSQSYKTHQIQNVVWALSQNLTSFSNTKTLLHVGAGLGAVPLRIASAGFRVTAFEPNQLNLELLKRTIRCASPDIRQKVIIQPYALGSKAQVCSLYSPVTNTGSAHFCCGSDGCFGVANATFRGLCKVRKLEHVFKGQNVVLIDGHQGHFVLTGAEQVLQHIPFLVVKSHVVQNSKTYLNTTPRHLFLLSLHYKCSKQSFAGSMQDPSIYDRASENYLYCINRRVRIGDLVSF